MKIKYNEKIILTPKEMELLKSANELLNTIYGSVRSPELEKLSSDAVDAIVDVTAVCDVRED